MNPSNIKVKLKTYKNRHHASYVELADHPHVNTHCVYRSERVDTLIEPYNGPIIKIDFNKDGVAIGIEVLYSFEDDYEGDNDDGSEDEYGYQDEDE